MQLLWWLSCIERSCFPSVDTFLKDVQSVEHISKNTCVSDVFMCECPKTVYLSYVVDMWDFVDVNYLAENLEFQNVCKSDPRCLN